MKKVDKERVSRYRKEVSGKSEEIKRLCLKAGFEDALLGGSPVETWKKCGKPNCKCKEGGERRHGPYLAVQIRREGQQRNLTLKKSEEHFFAMAKHYQYQIRNRRRVIVLQAEVLESFDKMIEARTIWDKK